MTDSSRTGGATSIGGPDDGGRRKKPWWLWLLLVAALVVVALLLLSQCGSADGESADAPSTTTSSQSETPAAASGTPTSTSTPPDPAATGSGTASASGTGDGAGTTTGALTADGAPLLPLTSSAPDGSLAAYDGQTVEARGVTVLSVPADEGFWVGTSDTDRVWVQLTAGGESPYEVTEGDTVDLDGTMAAHDATFAAEVGVTAEEGAEQLAIQSEHIAAARDAITLTR